MMKKIFVLFLSFVMAVTLCHAFDRHGERYGWPEQMPPKELIICKQTNQKAESMLLESLSGLAAKAVNEGRFDKMVWIQTDNESYERILDKSLDALKIQKVIYMDIWELLAYLKQQKIVKGYVLYELESDRKEKISNYSSNIATVYASLLSGVLIDSSLQERATMHGLKKLKDARRESTAECFKKNKQKLNNSSALSIHPSVSNMRDYAIAHGLMLYADEKEVIDDILAWVKPLSPILGWGCGDEFEFTKLASEWGHFNTASDWCINLPFISAAAPYISLRKVKEIGLEEINFSDTTYVHSFVMSDGDNMQWTMGSFVDNLNYLGHSQATLEGINWTLCPSNLAVISPASWNAIVEKQGKASYIEYGGGYQYPDLFAIKRENRKELLRDFAKRVNSFLKETNIKIFGVICQDVTSDRAQEAFQIYAEELTDITGIIAIQYFPYELGKKVFWYSNKQGMQIPVVTATFSLWNEVSKQRSNCGTPEYISSLVNRDEKLAVGKERYSWTIVHAWSDFSKTSKSTLQNAIGVNPILATRKLLDNNVRMVSMNELLWRIRMMYYPEEVKKLIFQGN